MVLSLLTPKLDNRGLYYGKYRYRATFSLYGLHRASGARTMLDYLKRIKRASEYDWPDAAERIAKEIANIDLDKIELFFDWKLTHTGKGKSSTVRLSVNDAGVYSNDLDALRTLVSIAPVTYSQVDITIPEGVKFFRYTPIRKFRVYFKSKVVTTDFRQELRDFLHRYRDSIKPSNGLGYWLRETHPYWVQTTRPWYQRSIPASCFLEYDTESMLSLISLMCPGGLSRNYKLLKRPPK